VLHSAAGKALQ
jgi:hypothetical protein